MKNTIKNLLRVKAGAKGPVILLSALFSISPLFTTAPMAAKPPAAAKVISHNISVTVSPFARTLHGTDTIKADAAGGRLRLVLNRRVRLTRVRVNGKKPHLIVNNLNDEAFKELIIKLSPGKVKKKPITIHISFKETFASIKSSELNVKRGISYVNRGVMGRRGIFLPSTSYWYPHTENGTAEYNLSINMPRGYTTVSEGDWMLHMSSADRTFDRWKTLKPVDGLDVISSKFHVKKTIHNGVKIYTFFLKREKKLSATYTKKTGEYIDLYSGLFGKYPFTKFAVVESFLPTGYGMPSFTLLGSKVLRLPFIPDTSLGHEIAHSWWGNSVYIDPSLGNWSEAITTYTADYLYERKKGADEAAKFRFKKLEGYKNFADSGAPSLHKFVEATEPSDRAVGYNKGVMVFAMLEDLLGSETFNRGLKEFYTKNAFKRATWGDIEEAFESASGEELTWFFEQWLGRKGGPKLALGNVAVKEAAEDGFVTTFKISQRTPLYTMTLPLMLRTADGKKIEKKLDIKNKTTRFSISTPTRPTALEVDPNYRVFRILSAGEVPPSLSVVLGDKESLVVVTGNKAGRAGRTKGAKLLAKDYTLKTADINEGDLKKTLEKKSLFLLNGPGLPPLLKGLELNLPADIGLSKEGVAIGKKTYKTKGTAIAIALKNPYNAEKNIVIFSTNTTAPEKTLKEIKKIRYYTKYSYVLLQNGKVVKKGFLSAPNALSHDFKEKNPS